MPLPVLKMCPQALSWLLALSGLSALTLAQEGEERRRPQRPQRQDTAQPADSAPAPELREAKRGGPPLRLKVTVFRLELTPEKALELDAATLEREAGTPVLLAKALARLGSPELMYRAEQTVRAEGSGKVSTSRDTPYVTGSGVTADGRPITNVGRERGGTSVDCLVGAPIMNEDGRRVVFATVRLEFAGYFPSTVAVGDEVTAPVFWKSQQSHGGELQLDRPLVLISVDSQTAVPSGQPQAFVSLITLSQP